MSERLAPIVTHVGHAEWGSNRYAGFDVRDELAGPETYVGLLTLAVAHRRLKEGEQDVLNDIAVIMTVADPRIWPLKLARIVASYGGALAGAAAASLCIEEATIGHWTSGHAAQLLVDFQNELGDDASDGRLDAALAKRLSSGVRLVGFGVPFRDTDERVAMLAECLSWRGRDRLRHWTLFQRLSDSARRLRRLEPNVGLAVGAACLDLEFSPAEISVLAAALGQNDIWSNALEGARQQAPALQTLPADCIRYAGAEPRTSPKRGARQT